MDDINTSARRRRAPAPAAAWPATWSLAAGRPRVLVRAGDLPRLRRLARTTHRAELASLVALAREFAGMRTLPSPDECNRAALRLAFLRLITGDREHTRQAIRCLERALELGVDGNYGAGSFRLHTVASAYDWLHDALPKRLRGEVGERALAQSQALYDSGEVDAFGTFAGHGVNQVPYILMAGLAVGDDVDGDAPRVARPLPSRGPREPADYVNDVLWRVERMFDCYRHFLAGASFAQSYAYSIAYVGEIPYLLQLLESGLGRRAWAQNAWFRNAVDWYTYALRADETFLRFGDYFCREGVFDTPYVYRPMAAIASRYRDPLARWWTDRFRVAGCEIDAFVFDERPGVRARGPDKLPRTRLFAPMGTAIARGDFADGTIAALKCSPLYLHNHCHRDQNSLVIYHRGEQAIDSGAYDGYESPHWKNYYIRTIAHNSLVVHDSEEHMSMRGWPLANDGGQRFVNTPDFAPRRAEDIARECFVDGRIAAWREGDGWSYACGDASRCYHPRKLARFLRHVVFVLDWPHRGAVSLVVLDEVELARDGLVPRILLHTVDQPTVDGRRVAAAQGGGRLTMHALLPEDARLETIGGPGRECWVDGRNFPVDPHADEELHRHGAWHAPGAWRVEVSPGAARRSVEFLTVWNPADADAPAEHAPSAERVDGGWIVRQGALAVGLFRPGAAAAVTGERVIAIELAR